MLMCLHSWRTSGDIVIYMTISWDAVQVFFSLLGDCDKNSLRVLSVENTLYKQEGGKWRIDIEIQPGLKTICSEYHWRCSKSTLILKTVSALLFIVQSRVHKRISSQGAIVGVLQQQHK